MKRFKKWLSTWRAILFPKDFHERYHHVGTFWFTEGKQSEKWILPIVLLLDYKMRPRWCPQVLLRIITYLATGFSIVRVRNNWIYYNVYLKITKGIKFWDWKTKWENYDLRISVHADENTHWLCEAIEAKAYRDGCREEMISELKSFYGEQYEGHKYKSYCEIVELVSEMYRLQEQIEEQTLKQENHDR